MIKKIFLFLLLSLTLFSSVNSATQYINSCSNSVISGTSNNEYVINITEVPLSYTDPICVRFYSNHQTNMTLRGINQTVINNAPTTLDYLFSVEMSADLTYSTFKDIGVNKALNGLVYVKQRGGGNYNDVNYNLFSNLWIDGDSKYFMTFGSLEDVTVASDWFSYFKYNDIVNSRANNLQEAIFLINRYNSGTSAYQRSEMSNNQIFDSYFLSDSEINLVDYSTNLYSLATFKDNEFYTSVVPANTCDSCNNFNDGSYDESIVKGFLHSDSNDDGDSDSDIYTDMTNMKIYLDFESKRFVQDYEEGEPFMGVTGKDALIPINDGKAGSPTVVFIDSPLDSSYIDTNLTNHNALSLSDSSIDCSIMTSEKCYMFNDPYSTSSITNEFGSYIPVESNSLVNNINISISHDTGLGSVYASIIANNGALTYDNIVITNNELKSTGNIYVSPEEDEGRPFVQLKANNIDISNNNFLYDFPTNIGVGDFLWISSLNEDSNNVYLNRFENDVIAPTVTTKVFGWQGSTNFYNNFVGTNVVLSSTSLPALNQNKLVGYLHTDNSIYYFTIGNYYEDNTGCVDSTSDGICDSSYTSGSITDDNPLSEYPFDFENHLLTAESVVSVSDFNITLIQPTYNETIELTGLTDTYSLQFSHNSDFIDLVCDYILDGSLVDSKAPPLTPKDTTLSTQLTGYTEKTYTYRVECSNEFKTESSEEISFTVEYLAIIEGCTDTEANNYNQSATVDDGSCTYDVTGTPDLTDIDFGIGSILSGSPEDSVSDLSSLFGLLDKPVGFTMLIGFMFIFVALIVLLMTLLITGYKMMTGL